MTLTEARDRATLTVPEAAQLLGIGRDNAYAAVKAGQLPSLTIGRRLLVPVPALLALLGEPTDDAAREALSRGPQPAGTASAQVSGTAQPPAPGRSTAAVYPLPSR